MVAGFGFACGQTGEQGGDTPTAAYKRLYAAVKSKDTEAIKKNFTKKTIEFGTMAASLNEKSLDQVFSNGMTATTFSKTLPSIRDERVNDTMAAVEVWDSIDSRWEDLPFMLEDGAWKLAVGDAFAGTYQSPGNGRDQREKEAANALRPSPTVSSLDSNANRPPTMGKVPTGPLTGNKPK